MLKFKAIVTYRNQRDTNPVQWEREIEAENLQKAMRITAEKFRKNVRWGDPIKTDVREITA